ncbi:hypothetical protein CYMTET_25216 [Cymbomonas tetramitiformis]|uniref:Uncharacterized protein n=1 Tax=Cymbomonas tetramitiformis TaxID=36881 RepID=A0AAE0FVS4_9CHLO|nr:hypothetical protein CYMTET_25216 [Cymbomonas tetramitiformis]
MASRVGCRDGWRRVRALPAARQLAPVFQTVGLRELWFRALCATKRFASEFTAGPGAGSLGSKFNTSEFAAGPGAGSLGSKFNTSEFAAGPGAGSLGSKFNTSEFAAGTSIANQPSYLDRLHRTQEHIEH